MQQDFKSMQKLYLKALTYFILIFILVVDVIVMSKIIARERDKLPCFTEGCFNLSLPADINITNLTLGYYGFDIWGWR